MSKERDFSITPPAGGFSRNDILLILMTSSLKKHLLTVIVAFIIVVGVIFVLQNYITEPENGINEDEIAQHELMFLEPLVFTEEEIASATKAILANENVLSFTITTKGIPEDRVTQWQEQFEAAKEMVLEAADNFNSWKIIGALHKAIGNYEAARDVWEYMGIIRPENSLSFGNLGDLYMGFLVDFEKAEYNLLRAMQNEPQGMTYYRNLHTLYASGYKKELADDVLLTGFKANPESVNLMTLLASFYRDEGDIARALEWFEKALALDAENEAVKQEVERLKNLNI